jgi:hypothetical protein
MTDLPEFDLGAILAERDQPTTEVTFYLNELASATKDDLVKLAATKKGAELAAVEKQIAAVNKELESKKYTVTISAIPNRMLEDIQTKALVEFPMKLDLMGRDSDAVNVMDRNRRQNLLIWNAQIKDVFAPNGSHKPEWTIEETEAFHDHIPAAAQAAINNAIGELRDRADEYVVKAKNVDFS